MENEFVPYELAVKLKAIGFDEPCFGCYDDKAVFGLTVMSIKQYYTNSKEDTWNCAAPLYQQAFRFFREKYKLIGLVKRDINRNYNGWWFEILSQIEEKYNPILLYSEDFNKDTYEEAELACLRKLAELYYNENYGRNNETQDLHNP